MMKALPPAMSSVGSGLILSKSHMQKAMDIPASQQTIDISASTVPEVAPKPQPKHFSHIQLILYKISFDM